jgi:hypothetical protein
VSSILWLAGLFINHVQRVSELKGDRGPLKLPELFDKVPVPRQPVNINTKSTFIARNLKELCHGLRILF